MAPFARSRPENRAAGLLAVVSLDAQPRGCSKVDSSRLNLNPADDANDDDDDDDVDEARDVCSFGRRRRLPGTELENNDLQLKRRALLSFPERLNRKITLKSIIRKPEATLMRVV